MKKLVCLLMLFALGCPVLAEIQPPKWEEFAPDGYANVEYIEYKGLNPALGMLLACSIVGSPIAFADLNKQSRVESNNYWYNRRKEFEQEINSCKNAANESELSYGYLSIRQNELSKNTDRKMSIMQAQQNYTATQQNVQRSNLQSQINNVQTQNTFNQIQRNLRGY